MQRRQLQLPQLDEAARSLRETGEYWVALSAGDLAALLRSAIEGALVGQSTVRAEAPPPQVEITNGVGRLRAELRIQQPIKATVRLNGVLINAPAPGRVRLEELDVRQEAGLLAKTALRAVDIEGRIRRGIGDPNDTLKQALTEQLAMRGVRLTTLELHLTETTLQVHMTGQPI